MLALVTACSNTSHQPTGIVVCVEVRSEYTVPKELDALHIHGDRTDRPAGTEAPLDKTFALGTSAGKYALPARLELLPSGNGNGAVHIDVQGQLEGRLAYRAKRDACILHGALGLAVSESSEGVRRDTVPDRGMTCLDGTCQGDTITSSKLPSAYPMTTMMGRCWC